LIASRLTSLSRYLFAATIGSALSVRNPDSAIPEIFTDLDKLRSHKSAVIIPRTTGLFATPPPLWRLAFPPADRDEHPGEAKYSREKAGHIFVWWKDHDGNGQQDQVREQNQPAFPSRWKSPTPAVGLGREPVPRWVLPVGGCVVDRYEQRWNLVDLVAEEISLNPCAYGVPRYAGVLP
jgi:hypothetical protein